MAHEFINFIDKVKRHYAFSYSEIRNLIVSILIIGFIVGFDDGVPGGTFVFWILNLVNSMVIVALAFLVHVSGHRLAALFAGYRAEYRVWWYGLLIGLILSILSRGKLWFILPGGYICDLLERQRLGKFRYGINYYTLGLVGFIGPLANIIIAFVFKLLMYIPVLNSNHLLYTAMLVNILFAVFTLLPLPGLSGANLLYSSRITYVALYAWVILAGVLMLYYSLFVTILVSFIGAIIASGLFYRWYEAASWDEGTKGP